MLMQIYGTTALEAKEIIWNENVKMEQRHGDA